MTRYPIVHVRVARRLWRLEEFCAAAGLHPELVRRFTALGLLAPERDGAGELWFDRAQLARVGRIQRLRSGLGLNYAAVGLVLDLLARIEELEAELRNPILRNSALGNSALRNSALRNSGLGNSGLGNSGLGNSGLGSAARRGAAPSHME